MKVKSCKNDIIWTEIESLELLLGVNFGILLNRIVRLELQVNYWGGDLRKLGRRYREHVIGKEKSVRIIVLAHWGSVSAH